MRQTRHGAWVRPAAGGGLRGAPSGTPGGAAGQGQGRERRKSILEGAPSPQADAQGKLNFMGVRSGKWQITVKAPAAEKAKVYLEGR